MTLLWEPSRERIEAATLSRYQGWLEPRLGRNFDSYMKLWEWSVEEIDSFWASIWEFFELGGRYERVLGRRDMPGAEWFPGAQLNYAEHVFRDKDAGLVAVRSADERRALRETTWGDLADLTGRMVAALRAQEVGRGDRVAAYLPNGVEAVAALLACASIGAVWSACPPEFGAPGAIDRFAQIEPRVLLATDGYVYAGRTFDRRDVVDRLRRALPSLRATVLLQNAGCGTLPGALDWHEFIAVPGRPLEFEQVPFDHPLWILYSSGTTGPPKAIVHGHGGILLEQLKYQHLHLDAQAGDRVFWFTTTGWMMWNFLVGCLLTPASIVLFDGHPAHPDPRRLWDLAADAGVTCFGTSAGYIDACMKRGVKPRQGRDLSALRTIGSTGSTLSPEAFEWIYDQVGGDTWLFSASGGTDVCTAFVGGVPTLPVHRGELQGRSLGARVEAFDEHGRAVIGAVGELVLTEPLPSMPLRFWGDDPDHQRLRESYYDVFPGAWRHGDWIEITARGSAIIYGRSDSTINRGGVRMGTSEIYRAVLTLDEVVDAVVVDLADWVPLFVVLRAGIRIDDGLRRRIAARVREQCSPRHVPDAVMQIEEVPRTRSGKRLEVPIKRILLGDAPAKAADRGSLANPAALDWFVERAAGLRADANGRRA